MHDVNFWAILVVTIIHMIIGSLWYSDFLFAKTWRKLMGITDRDVKKAKDKGAGMGRSMIIAFVASFILFYVFAQSIIGSGAASVADSMELAFYTWLGFMAVVMLGSVLWEGKPWKLFWINSLYYLVTLLIASAVLFSWK